MNNRILSLALVKIDRSSTQVRATLCEETAEEYAETLRNGALFPPVIVFFDGSKYWLADGFHRIRAHEIAGRLYIDAEVRTGTKRDAILYAVGANVQHGLRPGRQDIRRAVTLLLTDAEWSMWADREIARRCGVSGWLVGQVREELSACSAQMRNGRATEAANGLSGKKRKVERGGTVYEMTLPTAPKKVKESDRSDLISDGLSLIGEARDVFAEVGKPADGVVLALDMATARVQELSDK